MPELITWAGRTLSGVDQFGKWVTTSLDGWWDSPEIKGDSAEKPGADGDFDLPIYNQARLITVTGNVHTKGHGQQHEAMNALNGLMAGRFQVTGHGAVQWADAKRNSGVRFTPLSDRLAQWQVKLKAADPRKFGELRTFSGSSDGPDVLVYHRGNYTATPKVTIRGSMPNGYTVWVGGQPTVVTRPMVTGPYIIDFNDGHLRNSAGTIMVGQIASASPANISPGQPIPVTVKGTGTATFDVEVLDTYI